MKRSFDSTTIEDNIYIKRGYNGRGIILTDKRGFMMRPIYDGSREAIIITVAKSNNYPDE